MPVVMVSVSIINTPFKKRLNCVCYWNIDNRSPYREIYCLWHQADTVATVSLETVEIFHIYSDVLLYVKKWFYDIFYWFQNWIGIDVYVLSVRARVLCAQVCVCAEFQVRRTSGIYSSDLYLFYLKWHMGKWFNWNKCRVKIGVKCSRDIVLILCLPIRGGKKHTHFSITVGASHKLEYFKRKNRIFSVFFSLQCHYFILGLITEGTKKE